MDEHDLPEAPEWRYHIESGVPQNYAVYDDSDEVVYRTTAWDDAVAWVKAHEGRP